MRELDPLLAIIAGRRPGCRRPAGANAAAAQAADRRHRMPELVDDIDVADDLRRRFLDRRCAAEHGGSGPTKDPQAVDRHRQRDQILARHVVGDLGKAADDLEAGVKQGGMEDIALGIRDLRRKRDQAERFAAFAPQRPHSAEARPEVVPLLLQSLIEAGMLHMARRLGRGLPMRDAMIAAVPGPHASRCARRPRGVALGPACDLDRAAVRRDAGLDLHHFLVGEHQRVMEDDALDFPGRVAQGLACRREHLLDVSGGRKHGRAVDAMIAEEAGRASPDMRLPARVRGAQTHTEQRVSRAVEAHGARFFRFRP